MKKETQEKIPGDASKNDQKEAATATEKSKSKLVRRLVLLVLLLIFLLVIIILSFGYALLKKTSTIPSTDAEQVADQFENYYGTIEGSLGYPSEYIPEMEICAISTKTKESFCTFEMLTNQKFTYDIGYALEVPAGTYTVFARLADPRDVGAQYGEDYKSYYSKFVTCGMSVECKSHTAIEVKVKGGETVSKVDPQDWYK